MTLSFRNRKGGALEASVPRLSRTALGVVCATLAAVGFAEADGGFSLGPAGIAAFAVAALALLYEERWTFDPASASIRFRFGLLFAAKTVSVPFADAEAVAVETFLKGRASDAAAPGGGTPEGGGSEGSGGSSPFASLGRSTFLARLFAPKRYYRLVVRLKDGERMVVDTVGERKAAILREAAERIAAMAGIPAEE